MTREEYTEARNALFAAAEEAVSNNDLEAAKAKKLEIEELDNNFEKAIEAKADLDALQGKIVEAPEAVKDNTTMGQEVKEMEKMS